MTLFSGWDPIIRILTIGPLAYAAIVVLLRVSGKRTLSKLNAFDLVVTVTLGSALATIILDRSVSLAEGVVVFVVLIVSQLVVTFLSVRFRWVERLVKSEPTLLFHKGEILHDAMRRNRVTESELKAAVRKSGLGSLEVVLAVVLETDGSLSVVALEASDGSLGADDLLRSS